MVGSTFLGHDCAVRSVHCLTRSSVHDDAVGDHGVKEDFGICCIIFVRFFHPEVHLLFARSRICAISIKVILIRASEVRKAKSGVHLIAVLGVNK